MRVLIFLLILTLLPISPAWSWSKADTNREIIYQGLHLIDWGQTITIAQHPDCFCERNIFMGKHLSVATVNLYMGASAVIHLGLSTLVPKQYRSLWQWATIIGTGYVVARNHSLGIRINF